jgi:hypothetical protein
VRSRSRHHADKLSGPACDRRTPAHCPPSGSSVCPEADELIQDLHHLRRLEVGSRMRREPLSHVDIHHGQDPDRAAIEQLVRHEAHCPDLVRRCCPRAPLPVAPGPPALGQLGPDRQPFLGVEGVGSFIVHGPSFAGAARAGAGSRTAPWSRPSLVVASSARSAGLAASVSAAKSDGTPWHHRPAVCQCRRRLVGDAPRHGAGRATPFLRSTSCSMVLSRPKSATRRLGLVLFARTRSHPAAVSAVGSRSSPFRRTTFSTDRRSARKRRACGRFRPPPCRSPPAAGQRQSAHTV